MQRIYGYCIFLENIQLKNVFKISIDPSLIPEHWKLENKVMESKLLATCCQVNRCQSQSVEHWFIIHSDF